MARKALTALVAVILVIVIIFAVYGGLTYPRTIISFSVSFTVGADSKTTGFDQQILDDKVQVQATVQSGAALWRARILSGDNIIWEHSAAQGEQQSYNSGWLQLPSGSYNFTFATVGIGSLNAQVNVLSKGGFW